MLTENEILLDMQETITDFSKTLFETIKRVNNIKQNAALLTNNYFNEDSDKILYRFLHLFNEVELQNQGQTLFKYNTLIKEKIKRGCKHHWIKDEIDFGGDKMQQICYCKLCEVSKKV